MTLILSNDEAEQLVTMPECIAMFEQAYRELAVGAAASTQRSEAATPAKEADTTYLLKLLGGVVPSLGVAAVRISSDLIALKQKRQVKMALAPGARYTSLVLLLSSETSEPLAICPDGVLQRMRVGATSGLGAKYLARADARTVGLLGAGWQAGAQVLAIVATHKIDLIRCYSPTQEKREAFCKEMSERTGVSVRSVSSPEQAVRGSDIVLCATNASHHVFFDGWLEPGMHVGTIRGAELEPVVVKQADIVAVHDRSPASLATTHGLAMPATRYAIAGGTDLSVPTLAELIAGTAPGRSSPTQKSCFLNLSGIGLQFAVIGSLFYRKAVAAGCGREVPTDWFTQDIAP